MQIRTNSSITVLVLLLALASLFVASCTQEAANDVVSSVPVVDSVASADGVMIQYETVGQGAPALVFVHGWSCDRSYWNEQAEEFAKDYRVVLVDMGGHGGSGLGREDWTVAAFGSDVAAVVNKLGLDSMIMIGHSMGGRVILQAARQLPGKVIGLVGADTYQNVAASYPEEQIAGMLAPFRADFAAAANVFVRSMFQPTADTSLVNKIAADMSSAPPEVACSAIENYVSGNAVEILTEVRLPIICINSDLWPTNVEAGKEHAASFDVKLMPGLGHFIMREDAPRFNFLLHEVIQELTGEKFDGAGEM